MTEPYDGSIGRLVCSCSVDNVVQKLPDDEATWRAINVPVRVRAGSDLMRASEAMVRFDTGLALPVVEVRYKAGYTEWPPFCPVPKGLMKPSEVEIDVLAERQQGVVLLVGHVLTLESSAGSGAERMILLRVVKEMDGPTATLFVRYHEEDENRPADYHPGAGRAGVHPHAR